MEALNVKSILVPTDLSESNVPALKFARMFSDRFNAHLAVVYADTTSYPVDMFADSAVVYSPAAPEAQEKFRSEIASRLKEWLRGRPFEVIIMPGQPSGVIVQVAQARQPDLIVMGTHGRRGLRRALLGSVAEAVLHTTTIPIVTVGPHSHSTTPAVTKIVCPVNFTEVAHETLQYATQLAEVFGAELIVLYVIEEGHTSSVDERAQHETKIRSWIDAGAQSICTYREIVQRGNAAERVLACVDDLGADLLVIGAQHKPFRDATVVGSTTHRLVRFAECPVLTVTKAAVPAGQATAEVTEKAVPAP